MHSHYLCFLHGETLDYKAPLLKALHALDKAAVDVCQYFDKNVTKVFATLGIEQEYFVVDTALYNSRPDLSITAEPCSAIHLLRDSSWKIIISVPFLTVYMPSCMTSKLKHSSWAFR